MIISLFENNLPMRFGVILYSTKLVEKIESNDGELPVAHLKDDQEDISTLVKFKRLDAFSYVFYLPIAAW